MSFSPPASSSLVAVQIPGRAPVDYFEPVVGGGPDDGRTAAATRWPPSSMEKGEERGSNQERNSKMAVVKRLHNALAKEFFSQSCANSFSFFGTFPQTEKRVRQRRRAKEGG